MQKYKWETRQQFANRLNVSRVTVLRWILEKRIKTWEPAAGVVLIPADQMRPVPMVPYQRAHTFRDLPQEMPQEDKSKM